MTDIRSPRLLCIKGLLLVLLGILAGGLLLAEHASVRSTLLLLVTVWAFCRAYYFAFYVLERYVDPPFRFSGLTSAAWFAARQILGGSSGNSSENIR